MASFHVVISVLVAHIVVISTLPLDLSNEQESGLQSTDEDYNMLFDSLRQTFDNDGEHSRDANIIDDYLLNELKPEGNKRRFSAWAGKRTDGSVSIPWGKLLRLSTNQKSRRGFQPWAGKRAFTPWAGKRSDMMSDKRGFTPWAGKRSEYSELENLNNDISEDKGNYYSAIKRGFAPWKGKRTSQQEVVPEDTSKDDLLNYSETKRGFSPWKGKRSDGNGGKRVFSPWAGK